MKKKARFFCENCQTEVKGNARFCGHCGRFFAAVKCPACGKTGASHAFANGCPQCGYAVSNSNSSSTETSKSILNDKKSVLKTNSKKKFNLKKLFSKSNNNQEKNYSEDSLPLWIYLVAIIFLVVILIMFSKMI
ncbi:MAG: zinc ribbon domain-containing protein [Treponemataceae bacterium]|nr:zinc ribbon domain-containing protein [Treponemataceae bacterium]